MKILLISNMYPSNKSPFYGIFVKKFEEQLAQYGFEFNKAVIKGRGKTKYAKIKKYFNFFIEVIRLVNKNDYDLIYVHNIGHSLLPLLLVKHRLQKPLIINAHGGDVLNNSKLSSFIQKLVVPIIMNADLIVVPSDYFQGVVHNKYLLDKDKIFVSPSSGIDKNLFNPNKGQTTETLTIGFVSRIDKGKGWDIFLDAISILTHRNLQFKVLMIGKGEEEKELIEKVEKLNLNFVVDYIGAKKHDELPEYFNQMDLFVFPTMLNESLGLVGLEAMACGVPVVGSNIGGLPGYIEDKVNGILFEAGNKKELANQIEYILKMRIDELNRYKNNALKTSSAYDARKVTQNLSKKLFELANRCI